MKPYIESAIFEPQESDKSGKYTFYKATDLGEIVIQYPNERQNHRVNPLDLKQMIMQTTIEGTILKLISTRLIQFSKKKEGLELYRLHSSISESAVIQLIDKAVVITVVENEVISIDKN